MTDINIIYDDIYPRFIERYIDFNTNTCKLCDSKLEITINKCKELNKCSLCTKKRKNIYCNTCDCNYSYYNTSNIICNKCCKCNLCNNDIDVGVLMSYEIKTLCNICYNSNQLL